LDNLNLPSSSNFYSTIRDKKQEEINHVFRKQGWNVRKSAFTEFQLENGWSDLVLQSDDEVQLLHGILVYDPANVKIIRQILMN
jgi:hypothetical protein